MAPGRPVRVSEFYERKRRLALGIALLSVTLLAVGYFLRFFLEGYGHPRVAGHAGGAWVIHRIRSAGEPESRSGLLGLDTGLRLRSRTILLGEARGLWVDGDEVAVVFANRYSVLRDGQIVRCRDLPQSWEIEACVHDPRRDCSWVFGWSAGRIVARRLLRGTESETMAVISAPRPERMAASLDGENGPLVAWREHGSTFVKAALYNGTEFVPAASWEVGPAPFWDAVLLGKRAMLLYYHRDRGFSVLRLRLRCCPSCGLPPLPPLLEFNDPVFVMGRSLTGLAAAVAGDRLLVAAARPSTIHMGSVPLATFRPEPGARLHPLEAEPLWRRLGAWIFPLLMLFFSFSLVFLGFTLLRERGRFVLERLVDPAEEGPEPAEILQRAMAFILDAMLLLPVLAVLADLLNAVPETTRFDPADGRWWGLLALSFGLDSVYHFALEWAGGWTVGKKIIGIRVVREDGGRLTFRGALLRNLTRPLDAQFPLGVFLGTSILMVTRRRQRPGDLLGRTLVVREPRGAGPRVSWPPARRGPPGSS